MGTAFESSLEMTAVRELFAPASVIRALCDIEVALARGQAALGLIDPRHVPTIEACCDASAFDAQGLVQGAAESGSLVIPFVRELRRRVATRDPDAEPFVHFGATSQDLIDTALALQGQRALEVVQGDLLALLQTLVRLNASHGHAPMLARTLMQPAQASCFGSRLLQWAAPLERCRRRLHELGPQALRLQLAGAVGTRAAWGERGQALARAVARELGLPPDLRIWQVQRDDMARLAAELGVLVGAVGKVAVDVALMSQVEVGEMAERQEPGRGGSSAMPHKRNPVGALVALAALQRAPQRVAAVIACMAHQQERALGPWQAESAELAELFILAASSVRAMAQALDGALVDEPRMLEHLMRHAGVQSGQAARELADQARRAAGLDEAWAGLSAAVAA